MKTIIVSKNGNGDFNNIAAAVNFVSKSKLAKAKIFIENGEYYERIFIYADNIIIEGEDRDKTIIFYDLFADKINEKGERLGTFRTATFFVGASSTTIKNLTIKNTAGRVGQAVALYIDGNNTSVKNCKLEGFQDTLFIGGLPLTAFNDTVHGGIKSYFTPEESVKDYNHILAYFEGCFISGDIDFIFGSGVAFFNKCELFSHAKDVGYVSAPSSPKDQEFGFVFNECSFTSDSLQETVYIARPWRQYGKIAVINCKFGAHIKRECYSDWDKAYARQTVEFCEFNSGETRGRVSFAKILGKEEAAQFSIRKVLGDSINFFTC